MVAQVVKMLTSRDKEKELKERERDETAMKIEKIRGKLGKYTRMEERPPVKVNEIDG